MKTSTHGFPTASLHPHSYIAILAALASLLASNARADFNPIALTPGSFTADVIVEKTAPRSINDYVTATMDGGTNNNSNTWYEKGFDSTRPNTGLPNSNSVFTAFADANRTFRMAPDFSTNAALCVYAAIPNGTLTLTTPSAFSAVSVLCAGGGAS